MVCTVEPLSLVDDSNVDEAGEVPIEEDVVSSVELLSLVDDSNVGSGHSGHICCKC